MLDGAGFINIHLGWGVEGGEACVGSANAFLGIDTVWHPV